MIAAMRRKFSSVISLLAGLACAVSSEALPRPNILFCLGDDFAWPHAGCYGDKVVRTPNIDRLAREGARFNFAFSAAPSCTPSRAAMLTGQWPHRLAEGANLHGTLPKRFPVYPDLLEQAGYAVGFTRKGWGPGNFKVGGRERNPAGPQFVDFKSFLSTVPTNQPFCFWFGSHEPHRPYEKGAGMRAGLKPEEVVVPPFWPDTPEVRGDILDYYTEVEQFDRDVGELLKLVEARGQTAETLVVVTGDNGWPFPRAKANLYDAGTRQPLIVRWLARVKAGQGFDDFVSLADLAPTFLEAAGLKPLPEMTGRSFLGLVSGTERPGKRNTVFIERERHANVRAGHLGYPCRAIRTRDFLYIRNFAPERWPAGDPEKWKAVGPFGDVDNGPTKEFILDHRGEPVVRNSFRLAFEKRPAEELYDLRQDPSQMNNVAGQAGYVAGQERSRMTLDQWMKDTDDPRAGEGQARFDAMPYYGADGPTSTNANRSSAGRTR